MKRRFITMSSTLMKSYYWTKVISEIENEARKNTKRNLIKKLDYTETLPRKLRARVEKIIPLNFIDSDSEADSDEIKIEKLETADINKDNSRDEKMENFNESTCSEILRKEAEFKHFKLTTEDRVERERATTKKRNWCSTFICKNRKERIKWDSKIYKTNENIWNKPIEEQADQLMDASAGRFSEWLSTVGSDPTTNISKEQIKSLFSIEGNKNLMAAIQTDPKEVNAIAKTVADRWNIPQMALELKYENYMKNRLKNAPKHIETVAFGRTIPYADRPWVASPDDKLIKTVFPNELVSGRVLFKGIRHLRSTKAFVAHCKKHPNVEMPKFLSEKATFESEAELGANPEVPLYEQLNLKFSFVE